MKYVYSLFFVLISIGSASAQTADTLTVKINGEGLDLTLNPDSIIEKEIVFEDSNHRYVVRISSKPKNAIAIKKDKELIPSEQNNKAKKIRNLFPDFSVGIAYPVGLTISYISDYALNASSDIIYNSNFSNQEFTPGLDLRLNVFSNTRQLNSSWWYKRSAQLNYYFFSCKSNSFSSQYTVKPSNQGTLPEPDSLLFKITSQSNIRYHKFGLVFPFTFEKVYHLNNAKQLGVSFGLSLNLNLSTNTETISGLQVLGISGRRSFPGFVFNSVAPTAGLRYQKFMWYGMIKYNPASNINSYLNPQHWLIQSGLSFGLY